MPKEFSNIDTIKVRQLSQFTIDYSKVKNLEYIDENKLPPQSFSQYRKLEAPEALKISEQPRPKFPVDLRYLQDFSHLQFPKGLILILVNGRVYPSIKDSISQYVMDVAYEGYFATVYTVIGGTPTEIRDFIKSKNIPRLDIRVVGVLMVGNLPVAWFEMDDDFGGGHAEFPCDLYYMDLNGTWNDPDNDGKFSEHPTLVEPEIWVGRLWTPAANGNDATLLNDYFSRNHKFRKGLFGCMNNALAFVDDDWIGFGNCAFDKMFSAADIEVLTDPATTDADRYKAEINQHRAWAQICAHSSPGGHSFKIPGGSEWVPYTYLRDVNSPNAYFYNLFACSNALFTQPDYMAGWYIFDKQPGGSICNGLAAVGSAKTGSMLLFENFYGPMGSGATIGQAFVRWWAALGNTHDLGMRQWYYGLTLLGDPTLNWWSGAVPTLCDPLNGDTFDHWPRLTHFHWNPVNLKNVNYYNIEIDAFGANDAGKWSAEVGKTWFVSGPLFNNNFEHMFVGAQPGRWRVRAQVGGLLGPWSDWSYFNYTL